jgi:hypothetical protein
LASSGRPSECSRCGVDRDFDMKPQCRKFAPARNGSLVNVPLSGVSFPNTALPLSRTEFGRAHPSPHRAQRPIFQGLAISLHFGLASSTLLAVAETVVRICRAARVIRTLNLGCVLPGDDGIRWRAAICLYILGAEESSRQVLVWADQIESGLARGMYHTFVILEAPRSLCRYKLRQIPGGRLPSSHPGCSQR